jgi:hypothetical protein
VSWFSRDARPHPEERAYRASAGNSNAGTHVSKDGDARVRAPSCFETHRSAANLRSMRAPCAAMLLSMRATVRSAFWPNEANRQRGREGPTCGCGEMRAGSPSCFGPVLYREPCNLKVGPQARRPARRSLLLVRRLRPTQHSSPRSRERRAEPQPFKILRSPLRSCRRFRRNGAAWPAWCPRKV